MIINFSLDDDFEISMNFKNFILHDNLLYYKNKEYLFMCDYKKNKRLYIIFDLFNLSHNNEKYLK